MRLIKEILWIDRKKSKAGNTYFKTTALLDNGEEATGFGKEFKEGDEVQVFHDYRWDEIKMRRGNENKD